jgi:hypothetical protein
MAGLSKSAIISLILDHIGGAKLMQAKTVFADGEKVAVKAAGGLGQLSQLANMAKSIVSGGIPNLSTFLPAEIKDVVGPLQSVSQLKQELFNNPVTEAISNAQQQLTSATSTVSSLTNLSPSQKTTLTASLGDLANTVTTFETHTNILCGRQDIPESTFIDANTAAQLISNNAVVLSKANSTYVNSQLATKANTSDITSAINSQNTYNHSVYAQNTAVYTVFAQNAAVSTALSLKANSDWVSNTFATVSYVDDAVTEATGGGVANTYLQANFTNNSVLTTTFATKADNAYVNGQLALYTNTANLTTSLNTKADNTFVTGQLALYTNTANLTTSLNTKADNTYVNSQLANYTNTANLTTLLNAKSDNTAVYSTFAQNTAVTSSLALKANLAGATFTGRINAVASSTSQASIRLPHGAAPTTPANGDIWTTTSGMYVRVAGATVGPLSPATATPTATTVSFTPSGNVAATNVQAAISELDNEKADAATFTSTFAQNTAVQTALGLKANSASPVFTGDVEVDGTVFVTGLIKSHTTVAQPGELYIANSDDSTWLDVYYSAPNWLIHTTSNVAFSKAITSPGAAFTNSISVSGATFAQIEFDITAGGTGAIWLDSEGFSYQVGGGASHNFLSGPVNAGTVNANLVSISSTAGTLEIERTTGASSIDFMRSSFGMEAQIFYDSTGLNISDYSIGKVTIDGDVVSTGTLTVPASSTAAPSLIIPHGTAPTTPSNGSIWTTTTGGLFARIGGVTWQFANVSYAASNTTVYSTFAQNTAVYSTFAQNTAVYSTFAQNTAVQTSLGLKMDKAGGTFSGDINVPIEAYSAGWSSSTEVPTKGDLYSKIETIIASSGSGDVTNTYLQSAFTNTANLNAALALKADANGTIAAANTLTRFDIRTINETPNDFFTYAMPVRYDFKVASSISAPVNVGGTYIGVVTLTPWTDNSGGYPSQFAIGTNGLSFRVGQTTTTWRAWKTVWDDSNFDPNTKAANTDVYSTFAQNTAVYSTFAQNTAVYSTFAQNTAVTTALGLKANAASPTFTGTTTIATASISGTATFTGAASEVGIDLSTNDQYANMRVIRNPAADNLFLNYGGGGNTILYNGATAIVNVHSSGINVVGTITPGTGGITGFTNTANLTTSLNAKSDNTAVYSTFAQNTAVYSTFAQNTAVQTSLGLKANTSMLAAVATSGSASDLSTGTLASARLPVQGVVIGVSGTSKASARYPTQAPYAFTAVQGNCSAKALVAATSSTTYTIKKGTVASPTTIGTFVFAAGGTTATVTITAGSISAGDVIWIEAPGTADATLADITFLVRA